MIAAAVDAFWARGYAGADVGEIAAAAGATKPSVYRRFASKDALFKAALAQYGAGHGARPLKAFQDAVDVGSAVCAFLRTAIEGQTDPLRPKGCFIACAMATGAQERPEIAESLAQGGEATIAAVKQRFDAAVKAGDLPAGFPSVARARLLTCAVHGFAMRARVGATREEMLADVAQHVNAILSTPQSA